MEKRKTNERGITLISLVITIILLLILATVAISLAVDSDGLFSKAGEARDDWNNSVADEKMEIEDLLAQLAEITGEPNAEEKRILEAIQEYETSGGADSLAEYIETKAWCEGIVYNEDTDRIIVVLNDSNNSYIVEADRTIAKRVKVSTAEELWEAVAKGASVILTSDITISNSGTSNGYGLTGVLQRHDGIIDGNGYTLTFTDVNGTWDSGISSAGGVIQNITITGAFRGIFIDKDISSDLILKNVTIDGCTYTVSADSANRTNKLTVINSTLNGYTAYANIFSSCTFYNCKFGESNDWAFFRPYAQSLLVDCEFEEGYEIDASRTTVTLENCKYNGTLITTENVTSLLGEKAANAIIK